ANTPPAHWLMAARICRRRFRRPDSSWTTVRRGGASRASGTTGWCSLGTGGSGPPCSRGGGARHWRIVAAVFVAAVLLAFGWSVTARPVFTGTALLRIEREEPRILKFEP